eukprot:8221396-Pyramimonas_sp.AAC.1
MPHNCPTLEVDDVFVHVSPRNKPTLVDKNSLGGNLGKRSVDGKGDELVVRVGEGNRSSCFRLTYDLGGGVVWVAALGKENGHCPIKLRRKVALLEQDGVGSAQGVGNGCTPFAQQA